MRDELLICSTEFPPLPGGIGAHAYGLINELSKHHELSLLTEIRGPKDDFLNFINENLTIHSAIGIERSTLSGLTYLIRLIKFIKARRNKKCIIFALFLILIILHRGLQ